MCLIVGYHAWSTFSFFKFIIKYHLDMSYGGMSITIVFFLINVIFFFTRYARHNLYFSNTLYTSNYDFKSTNILQNVLTLLKCYLLARK